MICRKQNNEVLSFMQNPPTPLFLFCFLAYGKMVMHPYAYVPLCFWIVERPFIRKYRFFPIVIKVFLGPLNASSLVVFSQHRVTIRRLFEYPSCARCLEIVEWWTWTPILDSFIAKVLVGIEVSWRIHCPIARDALPVIFFVRPLPVARRVVPFFLSFFYVDIYCW